MSKLLRMSSDFIIIPPRPEPAPEDRSPAALAQKWFASVRGIAPSTAASLREQVQRMLETGVCHHLLPKMPKEYQDDLELKLCVERVITDQWESLTPEERLLTRFPTVQEVGERFEIPKRGTGTVIRRELTRRFGIEMVFTLQDGSLFKWEFLD
jgi:hypothetical protein